EWERTALECPVKGNFVESELFIPRRAPHRKIGFQPISADRLLACRTQGFTKCLGTCGNGRAAPTRLIPVIARPRALSVNTTANSCATNTFCAAAPAPRRALTFG